jgi:hypothetical protein
MFFWGGECGFKREHKNELTNKVRSFIDEPIRYLICYQKAYFFHGSLASFMLTVFAFSEGLSVCLVYVNASSHRV